VHQPFLVLLEAKKKKKIFVTRISSDNFLPENCLVLVVDNQLFLPQQNHANQFVNKPLFKNNK
jgi:hypothetical protein